MLLKHLSWLSLCPLVQEIITRCGSFVRQKNTGQNTYRHGVHTYSALIFLYKCIFNKN